MTNEIYIASHLAKALGEMPPEQQDRIASLIDSLKNDGWKKSEVLAPDQSPGGGMRAAFSGSLSLIFRYAPEENAIIVTDVNDIGVHQLSGSSA